jgi:hypothetical protein
MEHFNEVVSWGRIEIAQIKVGHEFIERLRCFYEVIKFEDRFRVREIVLLQVVVKACPFRPEVWNASTNRNTSACHHKDPLELS